MFSYSHWLSTSPAIILISLIFLISAILGIKKFGLGNSNNRIIKYIFVSFVLTALLLAVSLAYTERGYSGFLFLYRHGLPHFYLIEGASFKSMNEVAGLISSKNIFMKNDWREILSGIIPLYLTLNFLFWFSIFFFSLIFIDVIKRTKYKD